MSKTTASAAGGAMPAESRPSRAQSATRIGDELDVIKSLVDAAYMAASDLEDFQRDAMRRLMDTTSSKIGEVQKEFTEVYCGGYVDVDAREPVDVNVRREATGHKAPSLLAITDALDMTRSLIIAASNLAAEMADTEGNALHAVICAAEDKLDGAREMLATIRGKKGESANV
jgi:hypothetical protein